MPPVSEKSVAKIKLLDQMLEDIAGDEFEDYDATESIKNPSVKHFNDAEEFDLIDITH